MFKNKTYINYKVLTINTVLILLIAYFIFHSLSGDRGVFAYFRLKKVIGEQTLALEILTEERIKIEHTVKNLHPSTLNPDFLDQLARKDLGLIGEGEKVIYLAKEP